ncbi:hypothetical protein LJR258_004347 [Rhizobium sp. LjRoot258]
MTFWPRNIHCFSRALKQSPHERRSYSLAACLLQHVEMTQACHPNIVGVGIDIQAIHRHQFVVQERPEKDFAGCIKAVSALFPLLRQLVHKSEAFFSGFLAKHFESLRKFLQVSERDGHPWEYRN